MIKFLRLLFSRKARQEQRYKTDTSRRELDVVLKIAKLCGHEVFFYNDAMKKTKEHKWCKPDTLCGSMS